MKRVFSLFIIFIFLLPYAIGDAIGENNMHYFVSYASIPCFFLSEEDILFVSRSEKNLLGKYSVLLNEIANHEDYFGTYGKETMKWQASGKCGICIGISDHYLLLTKKYTDMPLSAHVWKTEYIVYTKEDTGEWNELISETRINESDVPYDLCLCNNRIVKISYLDNNRLDIQMWNENAENWESIILDCQTPHDSMNIKSSCVRINYKEGIYWEPVSNSLLCFPASVGINSALYVLRDATLFYYDENCIWSTDQDSKEKSICINNIDCSWSSGFQIDGNKLYAFDQTNQCLLTYDIISQCMGASIELDVIPETWIVHDGILYYFYAGVINTITL